MYVYIHTYIHIYIYIYVYIYIYKAATFMYHVAFLSGDYLRYLNQRRFFPEKQGQERDCPAEAAMPTTDCRKICPRKPKT